MENTSPYSRYSFWILLTFAAFAVASIALQNLIWVAIALFLIDHLKNHREIVWPKGSFPLATILFLGTFFLGAVLGVDLSNSFHTVQKYLAMLMIFPLGAMALNKDQVRKLLLVFIYGAAFCALFGVLYKHFYLHQVRIDSFSGDKMVFGGMLMVSLLLLLYYLKETPKNPWLWTAAGLVGTALLFTQTRGAWLGFLAGLVLLLGRWNWKWLAAGLFLAAGSYFVLPSSLQDRAKSITDLHFSYDVHHEIVNSSQTRILIWISGLKMIKDHPLGVGQGNVEKLYPRYRLPALSEVEPDVPHLHNDLLQVLAQNGWLGLAAYLFWIFSYYWTALRFSSKNIGTMGLNWILLCAFSSVLVWGLTEYTFSHQFMNVQFFLLGLQLNLWGNKGQLQSMKR